MKITHIDIEEFADMSNIYDILQKPFKKQK
jgi:RNAse (barnase) inhibitor barstar